MPAFQEVFWGLGFGGVGVFCVRGFILRECNFWNCGSVHCFGNEGGRWLGGGVWAIGVDGGGGGGEGCGCEWVCLHMNVTSRLPGHPRKTLGHEYLRFRVQHRLELSEKGQGTPDACKLTRSLFSLCALSILGIGSDKFIKYK